jgi:phosphate transport system ATP-binding protein
MSNDTMTTKWLPPDPTNGSIFDTVEIPQTVAPQRPDNGTHRSQPSSLIASEVSAWFGARQVLERCTLRMEANEVTALIGPSGCGKSTFLRTLNRMHETIRGAKVAGTVDLDGLDIYGNEIGVTEVRVRIGMVFQKPNPFPSMSIRDNVLSGLKLAGKSHDDKDSLVEECLRRAGLWNEVKDRLNAGGMSLSGGQQQRLCIARSLAVKPRVLLMDEPCSALDPISTRVVEETVMELVNDVTVVIVTHNMHQAQRVSNKCAFFLVEDQAMAGRIIEHGPTDIMFSNPQDQRTLDYVSGRFG